MKKIWIALLLVFCLAAAGYAQDYIALAAKYGSDQSTGKIKSDTADLFSFSGKLHLRGIVPLHGDSPTEYPGVLAQLNADTRNLGPFRFHMNLEGGWDGTVHLPVEDHSTLKFGDRVYQSTTPFLEFKELYGSYSTDFLEVRAGIQRFAWGRLDEYPVNDLLNPWDYTQFLRKPLEERKIGVPSLSARLHRESWSLDAVWVPVLIPYRFPLNNERWSPFASQTLTTVTGYPVDMLTTDADIPARNPASGSGGLRVQKTGIVDWSINLFTGYDPRPVFKATRMVVAPAEGRIVIDPGMAADFHKISSIGADAAFVKGNWSVRAEAAYIIGRHFNTNFESWGFQDVAGFGVYPLPSNQFKTDTLEYGIGADYRVFEDCLLTMQVQQTFLFDRPDTAYDLKFETIFWANLRNGFLNQKIETNLNAAYNPEHGGVMAKANAWYVVTDWWKVGITAIGFRGNAQSLFGRYQNNDQVEIDLVFSW